MDLPAVEAGYAEKTQFHVYLRKEFQRHPWGRLALLLPAPDRHRAMLQSGAGGRAELVDGRGSVGGGLDVSGEQSTKHVGGESSLRRRTGQVVAS